MCVGLNYPGYTSVVLSLVSLLREIVLFLGGKVQCQKVQGQPEAAPLIRKRSALYDAELMNKNTPNFLIKNFKL